MIIVKIIFWICVFVIFWANIGYPMTIVVLDKILKKKKLLPLRIVMVERYT